MSWGDAAQGATNAIRLQQKDEQDLQAALADREYKRQLIIQQQQQHERLQQQMGMDQQRFDAEQAQRAQATSQANNARGVQQMVGELIRREGVTPQNRQQIVGTLMEAGRMPTQSDLDGPSQPTGDTQWVLGPDGQEVHRVPQPGDKRISAPTSASTPQQDWVRRGNEVIPIPRGTAQRGDMPFDPVQNRQAQPADATEARNLAQQALGHAERLKTHPGLSKAYGAYEMRGWTQEAQDAKALRNQLLAALALPNLGAIRGPLSDKDILFVKQLSSRLENNNISDDEAARAVDEAITYLKSKVDSGGGLAPKRTVTQQQLAEIAQRNGMSLQDANGITVQ
jgi:hypothetical protein